ncbi:hypothetical protein C8F04DRAFT_1007823 [Mycena alexandri]|uniref:ERCC4 domain-containing protein n=1 Tax=Mycena alexandri TaxID=1745969 RepID=A0AAD6SI03_9AGAR|nr:hypothetical protein C8F04DRAFT_1007823 [Mycena alexandri]
MPFSSDVIELSDSDDDARAPPPSSSQLSWNSFHEELVDLCSSDDELPAPGEPAFSRGLGTAKRKRHSMSSASSRSATLDHGAVSSDEEESPKKISRKTPASGTKTTRKPRKTEEEKAEAKALKQKEAAQKKAQKAAEKADKAAQVANEKATKKTYLEANKLVIDKKKTLENMEIVFPPSLRDSELEQAFRKHTAQFNMPVSIGSTNLVRGLDVFAWRRTMTAEYDVESRAWLPVPPHVRDEDTYLVYVKVDELARWIKEEDGAKAVVRRVRSACAPRKVQIFVMVNGLMLYLRRKTGIRYTKPEIERALAALQMAEHVHLLYIDKVDDAVVRLYDLSADLGIKPYKLITRSHLPFCSDTNQKTGTSPADTWVKMLGQVHRLTSAGAEGIAEAFPTANSLFTAYEQAVDARERDRLVMGCQIKRRADGVAKERSVGQALSQVVGTVMYSADPLQLTYKAAKGGVAAGA